MQANGFLSQKQRPHPIEMVVIVAGHVAVIGAVMLAKAPIIPDLPEAIEMIRIIETPPPPPIETPPPPERAETIPERVTVPTREVPSTSSDSDYVLPMFPPPPDPGPVGTGRPIDVAPPPVPIPVLTDAAIDMRFADDFQPPYPPGKQRLGEEGRAVLRVLIGKDGRVKRVERVSGDEAFLDVSERQALRRWRFKPATRDGVPIESWKTMTVRFEIS